MEILEAWISPWLLPVRPRSPIQQFCCVSDSSSAAVGTVCEVVVKVLKVLHFGSCRQTARDWAFFSLSEGADEVLEDFWEDSVSSADLVDSAAGRLEEVVLRPQLRCRQA